MVSSSVGTWPRLAQTAERRTGGVRSVIKATFIQQHKQYYPDLWLLLVWSPTPAALTHALGVANQTPPTLPHLGQQDASSRDLLVVLKGPSEHALTLATGSFSTEGDPTGHGAAAREGPASNIT